MPRTTNGSRRPKDRDGKKKQPVCRHWKPSLGIFVETYLRRGEQAKPKSRATKAACACGAPEDDRSPTVREACGHRNVLPLALLLLVLGGALTAAVLALARSRTSDSGTFNYEIRAAREPVLVEVDTPTPRQMVAASPKERRGLVNWVVREVVAAVHDQPRRLVVIDLGDASISFYSLPATDQQRLKEEFGAKAVQIYESAVAEFLGSVMDEVGNAPVSVLGLPVEPGFVGVEAARGTNRRYRSVIARLDPFVSAHIFLLSGSSLTEERLVQSALLEAIHRGRGRSVLFRTNSKWRVLIDSEALEPDKDSGDGAARWDMLLAETSEDIQRDRRINETTKADLDGGRCSTPQSVDK